MAQRDYVGRGRAGASRPKKNKHKTRRRPKVSKKLVVLAIAFLIALSGTLYFITQQKPASVPPAPTSKPRPRATLPPKPEERWRYIKELENRQIGVLSPTEPKAAREMNAQTRLTDEQQKLLGQIKIDMQQRPTPLLEQSQNPTAQPRNGARPPEAKPEIKQQETKPEQKSRWIVQCGSFRSSEQAQSVRAQLALKGLESHITTSGEWRRVVLGPFNSRTSVDNTLARLKNIGMSSCIPLSFGG